MKKLLLLFGVLMCVVAPCITDCSTASGEQDWIVYLYRTGEPTSGPRYWGIVKGSSSASVMAELKKEQAEELRLEDGKPRQGLTYFNFRGPVDRSDSSSEATAGKSGASVNSSGSAYTPRPDPYAARQEAQRRQQDAQMAEFRRQGDAIAARGAQRQQANDAMIAALSQLFAPRPRRPRYHSRTRTRHSYDSDDTPSTDTPQQTEPTESTEEISRHYEAARRIQESRQQADREAAQRELDEKVEDDFAPEATKVLWRQDEERTGEPAPEKQQPDPLFQLADAAVPDASTPLSDEATPTAKPDAPKEIAFTREGLDDYAEKALPAAENWLSLKDNTQGAFEEVQNFSYQVAGEQLAAEPPSQAQMLGFEDWSESASPSFREQSADVVGAAKSLFGSARDGARQWMAGDGLPDMIASGIEVEAGVSSGAYAKSPIIGGLFDRAADAIHTQITNRLAPPELQDSPDNTPEENANNKLFREAHPANIAVDVAKQSAPFPFNLIKGAKDYMDRNLDNFGKFMGFADEPSPENAEAQHDN